MEPSLRRSPLIGTLRPPIPVHAIALWIARLDLPTGRRLSAVPRPLPLGYSAIRRRQTSSGRMAQPGDRAYFPKAALPDRPRKDIIIRGGRNSVPTSCISGGRTSWHPRGCFRCSADGGPPAASAWCVAEMRDKGNAPSGPKRRSTTCAFVLIGRPADDTCSAWHVPKTSSVKIPASQRSSSTSAGPPGGGRAVTAVPAPGARRRRAAAAPRPGTLVVALFALRGTWFRLAVSLAFLAALLFGKTLTLEYLFPGFSFSSGHSRRRAGKVKSGVKNPAVLAVNHTATGRRSFCFHP